MIDKKLRAASLPKGNAPALVICPISPVIAPSEAFTRMIFDVECMVLPDQPVVVTPLIQLRCSLKLYPQGPTTPRGGDPSYDSNEVPDLRPYPKQKINYSYKGELFDPYATASAALECITQVNLSGGLLSGEFYPFLF